MSSIPAPDEQTHFSSRRRGDVDGSAWPVFSQRALELLRSAGEVLHPESGEVLWDAGDPYDLYLVLAGGVLLVDRPVRPHVGLLALRGALRLFELPAPGVAERARAVIRSAVDLVSAVAESSVSGQPSGSGSPRQAYQERLVATFRHGRDEPRAPEEVGGGPGGHHRGLAR